MPTVTLDRKEFEKFVGMRLPDDKLKDRISMIGTDLESLNEKEIVVEIFPNRPDWLSEQGFARAMSAFLGKKTGLPAYQVKKSGYKVVVDKSVSMRPYTACAIVKKLKFTDERIRETMQLQEKLATTHGRNRKKSEYGLYPSTKIAFPVTYIAKDPKDVLFQPLGFDKAITADQVEELHPKGRVYKDVAKGWKKYPFFIDGKNKVMSMLPYTNSEDMGKIDETTTEVFVECTGNDLNNVMVALNILVTTLADMGGEICSIDVVYPDKTITTPNLEPKKMKIDRGTINKLLGLNLNEKELKQLLEKMNYGYEKETEQKGTVLIPAYRGDIMHPVDIVEDVAIAYGYENFEEIIPKVATVAQEDPFAVFKRRLGYLLVGLGLLETRTYNLQDEHWQTQACNLTDEKLVAEILSILDPVSLEYNTLRLWMIPSLLHVLKINKHHEYPQKIFEIGRVFKKQDELENKSKEVERLCLVSAHADANFTEIKQYLEYLMKHLDATYTVEETEHPAFVVGRVGRVVCKGKKIAYVGEIHPQVLQNFELEMPVVALELNVSELFGLLKEG